MSMKVLGPSAQPLSFHDEDSARLRNTLSPSFGNSAAKREGQTQVNFGGPAEQTSGSSLFTSKTQGSNGINFGGQTAQLAGPTSTSAVQGNQNTQSNDDLGTLVRDLVSQLMRMISQMMQQNQSDPGSSAAGDGGGQKQVVGAASQPASSLAAAPAPTSDGASTASAAALPATANAPQNLAATGAQVAPTDETSKSTTSDASPPVAAAASATGSGPTGGSGPRTFNITNTQDHAIKIGQFDKNDKLSGEITLQPGEKGKMNFQSDFTGLLKQADADGNYKSDASRLEFYNGFINTSYIDGRNAAIHATDNKGFEIGDTQSIADKASGSIVTADSAGNKTVAGYYDGSSDAMNQGGKFMTDTLGTGMSYMHPDDDKLPQGQNPMRHTDSMALDVTFGKA